MKSSFEITDTPLIEYTASKGKPIIISTGIATFTDVLEALNTCQKVKNDQIALLKCVSAYPTPLEEVNLKNIPYLSNLFKVVVGLSDHTLSISVVVASVALGSCIIEKHLCLNRELGGADAGFSLEPEEFMIMVKLVREVEKALGEETYKYTEGMKKGKLLSKSLFAIKDIKRGEKFTTKNVNSIRPGDGKSPSLLKYLLGNKSNKSIKRGNPL